jgi:hypothetical protein
VLNTPAKTLTPRLGCLQVLLLKEMKYLRVREKVGYAERNGDRLKQSCRGFKIRSGSQ